MKDFTERKTNLGRGLAELFGSDVGSGAGLTDIAVSNLSPGSTQPRRIFEKEKIRQLAESIQDSGILQPILVRPRADIPGHYEIVAGERRWLAAQEAGLRVVPVIIRELSDIEALKIAIIENVQREDLNILEEAESYQRLMNDFGYTQEKIANDIGKSRSHVANTLRLLALPEEIKEFLASGHISAGHARALLNTDDAVHVASEIIKNKLNVRDVEKMTRGRSSSGEPRHDLSHSDKPHRGEQRLSEQSPDWIYIKTQLEGLLDVPISLTDKKGKLVVSLEFTNLEKLDAFVDYTMRAGPMGTF
jgi:ParB family chromosome partitioning protein